MVRAKAAELGLAGTVALIWKRLTARALKWWRRRFRNKQVVFRRSYESAPTPEYAAGLEVLRIERLEEIPAAVRSEIVERRAVAYLERVQVELELGAVFWIGVLEGHVVGTRMSRPGRKFPKRWYVPLKPDDIVIFGGQTWEEYRGMRISPTMINRICTRELQPGGAAYVDCQIWHKSSIRSIQHAGFERVGVMPHLKRAEVFA